MVDIAAHMLGAQIFIHDNSEAQTIIYQTKAYGYKERHLEFNGINHFVQLVPFKAHQTSTDEHLKQLIFSGGKVPLNLSEKQSESNAPQKKL